MDTIKTFPDKGTAIFTEAGKSITQKTDIFKTHHVV